MQQSGTEEDVARRFTAADAPAPPTPPPYLSPPPAPGDYDDAYAETLTASFMSVLIIFTAPNADGDAIRANGWAASDTRGR